MGKEKREKEQPKTKYMKPVLTKHKKLKDITAAKSVPLGCTKFTL